MSPSTRVRDAVGAGSRAAAAGGQTGRSIASLLGVLQRLVPLAGRLVRWVRILAVSSAVSVAIIVLAPLLLGWPSLVEAVGLALVALVLAAVPVVLWLLYDALVEVLALPGWLRASPEIVRHHGGELADLVVEARTAGRQGRRRRVHVVRDGWRAGKLLLATHAEVPGYGAALRLISIPFLAAVVVAVIGALVEITLAPVVVLLVLALRVL